MKIFSPLRVRLREFVAQPDGVAAVELEPAGVVRPTALVEPVREQDAAAVDLPAGAPDPVERREHGRVPVSVEVSAWTPAQPTRRLTGATVNLGPNGTLVSLPELAPHAATLELQIMLPDGPLHASGATRWRRGEDLAGVELVRITPERQARLVEFLRSLDG